MRRIVLFGGTFDPPHVGHLLMAQLAFEQYSCDAVWVMPSPTPPHKANQSVSPYETRRDMTRELLKGAEGLVLCDVEAERHEPSYTVDTVRILQEAYPDIEFQFLIGSDSLRDLPSWHGCDELSTRITFLVAARSEAPFTETYAQIKAVLPHLVALPLQMPMLDVSSSFIRQRLDEGKPVCGLVPDNVLAIWQKHVDAAQ
jgi:nicotinate-nucleotide adenylyltransferase